MSKQAPVRVKIPDVSDIKISKAVEADFINRCLTHEWNLNPVQVQGQINNRFNGKTTTHSRTSKEGAASDGKANRRSVNRPKSVFDDD